MGVYSLIPINDWKWTMHQLHPQRKTGCDLQTQGWIHGKSNLGCENCSTTKPSSFQLHKSHERRMADEWEMVGRRLNNRIIQDHKSKYEIRQNDPIRIIMVDGLRFRG